MRLPDAAGVYRHHGLPGFAPESFAELTHILHNAIDAELPRRVRIGLHLQPKLLRTSVAAPALPEAQEKLLHRSISILLLGKVNRLTFCVRKKCDVSQPQAAIVGGIFPQR